MMLNKNPEYFLTIANENSFSKAAAKLYVSQSYLSQHLLRLEKELDVQLFDRSTNPIKLTEAGKLYKKYLEQNQQLYTTFTTELDVINDQRIYSLNIGLPTWRGTTLLPDILPTFIREYPNVRIHLHEHPVKELYTLLEKGVADFCILNASVGYADRVTTEILAYEKILLVANKNNPKTAEIREMMEKDTAPFDLGILKDECFILIIE